MASYQIFIKWKREKTDYTAVDNIQNSGLLRPMIIEILLSLVMNYPSLYDSTYSEGANSASANIQFYTNDLLLCIMIFVRARYWVNFIINTSKYVEPRA